jgi:ectoine hydroxylase-related dioxygenase (phytanoyl-CoA dioxygenase family)
VHDANVANGTIHVIPGSYREAYEHSRDPYSDHHIRCYPPEANAIPLELPAGGVAFFGYGVAHGSKANKTDHERAGIAHHFINAAMDGHASSGFEVGKRPHLSGPQATGGEREHGVKITGTWEQEIAQVLTYS